MKRILASAAALAAVVLAATPAAAQQQTPIDINRSVVVRDQNPPTIEFHYGFADVTLTNTFGAKDETSPGRVIAQEWATLKATPSGTNYILVNGRQYDLLQFHFHTPLEHAVNGAKAPMEVHFVHIEHGLTGCAGAFEGRPLLVVGALITGAVGSSNGGSRLLSVRGDAGNHELARLFEENLPHDKYDTPVVVNGVNLAALLPTGSPDWRYEGGLTAPSNACGSFEPLSTQLVTGELPEAVHWFVYKQVVPLAPVAITRFRELFEEGNSRPLKAIGDRKVFERRSVRSSNQQ